MEMKSITKRELTKKRVQVGAITAAHRKGMMFR